MILIFEGGEKTGKSTLAEFLKNKLFREYTFGEIDNYYKYYRSTHQKDKTIDLEESIKSDWRFFLDIYQQVNFNIIFDRSFISQYVYSMIFRKNNVLKHFSDIKKYDKKVYNIYGSFILKEQSHLSIALNFSLLNSISPNEFLVAVSINPSV